MTPLSNLQDPRVKDLTNKIRDSFRVRPNRKPTYVEVGGYLVRVLSQQHQIIFGRRGSGKSCLAVTGFEELKQTKQVIPVYIDSDGIKLLGYPDLLIKLLLKLMDKVYEATPFYLRVCHAPRLSLLKRYRAELQRLLDEPDESQVTEQRKNTINEELRAGASNKGLGLNAQASTATANEVGRTSQFKQKKLDTLERHLTDYVHALERATKNRVIIAFIDDFYLIPRQYQPNVLDYIHRLFRNSNFYFKIATIRHRTTHIRTNGQQTVGVELSQDVEPINLDKTLEDLDATRTFLETMLDKMAEEVGIPNASTALFNPDAMEELTLVSGGVARDFLNILVDAIDESVSNQSIKWLTPTYIRKAAARNLYKTKLPNLREQAGDDGSDLEKVYTDLLKFCLGEKKKTAFLISQAEVMQFPSEHELIQQLMDFKLIHVIEPDTSAASGRTGRYEAYTLDFSIFKEPRMRNIEYVEFWKIDDQRRRQGVRESPVYSLERAKTAVAGASQKMETSIEAMNAANDSSASGQARTEEDWRFVRAARNLAVSKLDPSCAESFIVG